MTEEKIEKFFPWQVFFWGTFLFSFALFLGIISGLSWQEEFKFQETQPETIPLWKFLFYFFLGTFFILLLSLFGKRFQKQKSLIFKGLFLIISFLGIVYFFFPFLNIFSFLFALFFTYFWQKKQNIFLNNLCFILGLAGLGSVLGLSLEPLVVIFLLAIFSIYDFIAVYKTKHMIKMAKEMLESKVIFGIILPKRISDFKASLKEIEQREKFLILGGGDVAFPLLLSVSLVPEGIFNSFFVAFFSLLGFFLSFYIFISQKRLIPALPPIALFSMIGYFLLQLKEIILI